jgi:hypothetical protein
VEEDDRLALALVEMGQPQAVDLAVDRLERVARQALQQLFRRAYEVNAHPAPSRRCLGRSGPIFRSAMREV